MIAINSDLMKQYYSILGIDPNSTPEAIRTAYRRLAKSAHPDIGGDPLSFRDIKDAYEILSDPIRRKEYDHRLAALPFDGEPYKTVKAIVRSVPVDVFDDVVDVLSRRIGFEKKAKIKAIIPVSEKDAAAGINLEIVLPMKMICQRCFGFGGTLISTCGQCAGKGMINENKMVYVRVEPGTGDDDVIVGRVGKIEIQGTIKIKE